MIRSGFKPKRYEAPPRAPLVPVVGCRGVIRPVSDVVTSQPKSTPERSESYRRWVASLPCFGCGIEGYSQAAHPNQGRGLGQKASDLDCFPLCCVRPGHMGCHQMHDLLLGMTLDQRREIELSYIERMHRIARHIGRPEIMT